MTRIAMAGLAVAAAVIAAAAVALASCGQTEEGRVVAVVEQLQEDFATGDFAAVCEAVTVRTARQIGAFGHGGEATICTRDVLAWMESDDLVAGSGGDAMKRARKPEVVDVTVGADGDSATVVLTFGGDPFEVPMVRVDGEWRLDDFLGASAPPPRALR